MSRSGSWGMRTRPPVHPRGREEHAGFGSNSGTRSGSSPRARGTREPHPVRQSVARFIPAGAGNTAGPGTPGTRMSVHPRGRGEHGIMADEHIRAAGSSPRARGTQARGQGAALALRFIPAGAGNTCSGRSASRSRPVHPRGRGEHSSPVIPTAASAGSSPRARGTRLVARRAAERARFIPAGAGNTRCGGGRRCARPVHPRGRGEHGLQHGHGHGEAGSSPRARGTRACAHMSRTQKRFIPAGAGNTRPAPSWRRAWPVHPRGRGEHKSAPNWDAVAVGSSPRARGTRLEPPFVGGQIRFIPAGAGNTPASATPASRWPVHPRGRGEHSHVSPLGVLSDGSSPRARGTLQAVLLRPLPHRFIPAGAGNTVVISTVSAPASVHPRGRGEHAWGNPRFSRKGGSSPRARGTRRCCQRSPGQGRFIPAGAGNTATAASARGCDTVHPRGRGEHWNSSRPSGRSTGSSPRARGTRRTGTWSPRLSRFIPAGAGNTPDRPGGAGPRAVHPRGRGEHNIKTYLNGDWSGSSPRARGTQYQDLPQRRLERFIPAGAGNTTIGHHSLRACSVHPRGRGEHNPHAACMSVLAGSSPRARGTQILSVREGQGGRFIPAGAGNTHEVQGAG